MDGSSDPSLNDRPSSAPDRRWVAVNTHPHREHVAVENLLRQNFAVYCPVELRTVRHARRVQAVTRPLFPGYIFAEIAPDHTQWRPILSTYGVRAVIRFGERLAYLDSGFIDGLRAREIDGVIAKPAIPYQLGQQVRLSGGPFDGVIARIIEMDERDRLVLLTSLLNQDVRLLVAWPNVRAV